MKKDHNSTFLIKNSVYKIATITIASDRPTRRFGSVRPNRSDKQWVRSVLAKNFRTPNGSVVLFLHFPQEKGVLFPYKMRN